MTDIINFYLSRKTPVLTETRCQFTYKQVMRFTHHEMEAHHNYIQWLFPLNEPSMIISAPLVNDEVIKRFSKPIMKQRLLMAFNKFINFIGLKLIDGVITGNDKGIFHRRVIIKNHNQQRITRVLKSMILLGQPCLAQTLYDFLSNYEVNPITREYWDEAMR